MYSFQRIMFLTLSFVTCFLSARPYDVIWSPAIAKELYQEDPTWTVLHDAAICFDSKNQRNASVEEALAMIQDLLAENSALINQQDRFGQTPLWWAANNGQLAIVKYLCEHGAQLNSLDRWERAPITQAAFHGDIDMVYFLLAHGGSSKHIDLHSLSIRDDSRETEFNRAFIARMLLKQPDYHGYTKDKLRNTPLDIANESRGNPEIVPILTQYVNKYVLVPNSDKTIRLFDEPAELNELLLRAVRAGSLKGVEELLFEGADPNVHYHIPSHEKIEPEEQLMVQIFMHAGMKELAEKEIKYFKEREKQPGYYSWEGWAPLHLAAYKGSPKIVRLLLKHDANVNERASEGKGETPLHIAAKEEGYSEEIILRLYIAGADINAQDKDGLTPLHIALLNKNFWVAHTFMGLSADSSISDAQGRTAYDIAVENNAEEDILKRLYVPSSNKYKEEL